MTSPSWEQGGGGKRLRRRGSLLAICHGTPSAYGYTLADAHAYNPAGILRVRRERLTATRRHICQTPFPFTNYSPVSVARSPFMPTAGDACQAKKKVKQMCPTDSGTRKMCCQSSTFGHFLRIPMYKLFDLFDHISKVPMYDLFDPLTTAQGSREYPCRICSTPWPLIEDTNVEIKNKEMTPSIEQCSCPLRTTKHTQMTDSSTDLAGSQAVPAHCACNRHDPTPENSRVGLLSLAPNQSPSRAM